LGRSSGIGKGFIFFAGADSYIFENLYSISFLNLRPRSPLGHSLEESTLEALAQLVLSIRTNLI